MTHIVLNTKFEEIEKKIINVSGVVATNVLNTKTKEDEGKIPNVSGLIKKDYDAKIWVIGKKCFTTSHYNKFTKEILDEKIKEKKLVD